MFCIGVRLAGELRRVSVRISKKGEPWSGERGTGSPGQIEEWVLEVGRSLKDGDVNP